ncbi:hypothetical protein L1049_023062 [Liquidambar formosana]|uniref:Exostosin GT47 domain-containing protein n=1 Tax=Liquidambar formosana TaxID=63359 RepID=A0AAP0RDL1_LIQFO
MAFRKHPPTVNPGTERDKYTKDKEPNIPFVNFQFKHALSLVIFLSIWFFLLFFWFPPKTTQPHLHNDSKITTTTKSPTMPTCYGGASVYVYDLPPEFNLGLLKDCPHLNVYTDMCPHVANSGLGQQLSDMGPSTSSWFATHQFIAEMIFHARVEKHPCRTWDPVRANLFYVPFYGGLYASSKFREQNLTARDALAVKLINYLREQPWWERHHGKDHFLALGRTAWDFMRTTGGTDFGANCLLNLPPVQNMSVLTVERNPWKGSNQHGIPYSSYFHPSTSDEMVAWQHRMRQSERPHLFSFIGGPREGLEKAAVRNEIIKQCAESTRCELLKCGKGASQCHEPKEVLKVMTRSHFCLQAPGDSFTRRSTFDSVLAGCVPVFFSPHTAYSQYEWFFPGDPNTYSVYVRGNATRRIEEVLSEIPAYKIERMRSTVIDLIPTITYVHPNASHYRFRDAVDVALQALSKHVQSKLRLPMKKQKTLVSS